MASRMCIASAPFRSVVVTGRPPRRTAARCVAQVDPNSTSKVDQDAASSRITPPSQVAEVVAPSTAPTLFEASINGQPRAYSFGDAMAFAGPAPELVNGRLAMVGFVSAAGAELATGQPILQQLGDATAWIAVTFGIVVAASLIPLLNGVDRQTSVGPLTPQVEMWNGQAAMLGFAAMLMLEALYGKALL